MIRFPLIMIGIWIFGILFSAAISIATIGGAIWIALYLAKMYGLI